MVAASACFADVSDIPTVASQTQTVTARQSRPINFGTFTFNGGGSITLSPSGNCTAKNGAVLIAANCSPATIELVNTENRSRQVEIELPLEGYMQNAKDGGQLSLNNFTMNMQNPVTLEPLGRKTVQIGATLNAGGNATSADFSGSFTFNVIPLP